MKQKKIISIAIVSLMMMMTIASIVVIGDEDFINDPPIDVYVVPAVQHIEVGNTSFIRLFANIPCKLSGWGFNDINFTAGVINVSKVRIGSKYPSTSDYYIFQDNGTMYGTGPIHNNTGVIGGDTYNYYYEAISVGGGYVNNTNRTVVNMTIQAKKCGHADITLYAAANQYFGYSGVPISLIFHGTTTYIHPKKASTLTAILSAPTTLTLSWTKGLGSQSTIVRGKLNSYPTNIYDGTWGGNTSSQTVDHTGLTAGQVWYYKAWSWNETAHLASLTYSFTSASVPAGGALHWHNVTKVLVYNAIAGGGLNFFSALNTTTASAMATLIGSNCTQVFHWDETTQSWSASYIPGVGGDFSISIGEAIGVEVTATTTIILRGYSSNSARSLYYDNGVGGLNWLGRTNTTTHASTVNSALSIPATQIGYWNETMQRYQMYVPGVDIPGGIHDFSIMSGMAIYVEVTGTATLSQAGW